MKRIEFDCLLESDVVLHASSNTEGKIELLDYIPGSNFLGIVAKDYANFGNDAFDIFHGGKVRFSDAQPVIEGKRSFRIPLCWFQPKGSSLDKVYNLLHIKEDERKSLVGKNIQLKQMRSGFVTEDNYYAKLSHRYRQKSKYNPDKRRSEDGAMFGYSALPSKMLMRFSVEFDDDISDELIEKIVKQLEGTKRLGKSRSAEYGLVKISQCKEETKVSELKDFGTDMVLYAVSRVALIDESGTSVLKPTISLLGLPQSARIDWEETQIRTSRYSPYNMARRTRDYERFIIEKGSVIVIKDLPNDFDVKAYKSRIARGVGAFLSEGFGQILVNPAFLLQKNPALTKGEFQTKEEKEKKQDKKLETWVKMRAEKEHKKIVLLDSVEKSLNESENKFKGTKPSQWGKIREFAQRGYEANKEAIKEYLEKGKASKSQWSGGKSQELFRIINSFEGDKSAFLSLFATEMQKRVKKEKR